MKNFNVLFFSVFFVIFAPLVLFTISPRLLKAETYVVDREDSGVTVIEYVSGSKDTLEDVLMSLRLLGRPIKRIDPSELPAVQDRKYWRFNDVPIGPKIIVDQADKQADEIAKKAKEERKRALLKMTPQEFEEAKQLGLIR